MSPGAVPTRSTTTGTGIAILVAIVLLEIIRGIQMIALLPLYLNESLGLGAGSIGFILSAYLVADLLCRLPAGWLCDRVGRRPVLLTGMGLTLAVVPALALARDPLLIAVISVVNGAAAGTMWPAVYATVADSFPSEKRGAAMSVVNLCMMGGLATGPILGNLIIGLLSHTTAFWLCGILAAIALIVGIVLMREPTAIDHKEQGRGKGDRKDLVLIATATVLVTTAIAIPLPIANLFARDVLGLTPTGLALVLIAPALLAAFALIPSGRYADRKGRRTPLLVGLVLMLVPFGVSPLVGIPPAVLVSLGAAVVAFGYALVAPSINALLVDYLPTAARGTAAGAIVAVQGLGIAFGPSLGGQVYESISPFAPFVASAIFLAVALFCVIPVREPELGNRLDV